MAEKAVNANENVNSDNETSSEKLKKKKLKNTEDEKPHEVFIFSEDKLTLLKYNDNESHIIIPSYVKYIGDGAFKGKKLTSIVIPDSVVMIGHYAFSNCKNLTSLDLPDSVTQIGDYAFKGCKKLNSIEISANVKRIGRGACDFTAICRKNVYHELDERKNIYHEQEEKLSEKVLEEIHSVTENEEVEEFD